MNRKDAEVALEKTEAVRRELIHLMNGAGPFAGLLSDLSTVADILRTEVKARAKHIKRYRTTIQHEGGKRYRAAHSGPGVAVDRAQEAFKAGAIVAEVRRITDDVVIYDGPADVELDFKEW